MTLTDYCGAWGRGELLSQWDGAKNAPLTPEEVTYGSRQKVWWQCSQGHSWQAQIKARVQGTGCPYCAGRRVLPGYNDLASANPAVAAQWHPTLNGDLTPALVPAGSHKKVWWLCPDCGGGWQASVLARTGGGNGCPVCAGRQVAAGVNDLASAYPAVAAQWDQGRNGALTPNQVTPFSNRRVWWRCERGHSYRAVVAARTGSGSGCPYCAGRKVLPGFNDLAALWPALAAQWHPTLNGALTPEMVTAGSHKRVWWQCPQGHVWKAAVYPRTGARKCGCPVCAGRVNRKRSTPPGQGKRPYGDL